MRNLVLLLAVLFFMGEANNIEAKTVGTLFSEGIVRGTIIDSLEGAPIQFANVVLQKKADSSFVSGTASGTNGEFIFKNITEGEYLLKINSLGYTNKYVTNLSIKRDFAEHNLGTLKLNKSTVKLSEVTVSGEKVNEELRLDKKVINVSQNQNVSGGTALDVLENQPSVRVDQDGTVYLRGSSNFTILINGKPSVLQGSDALKQIAANTIENIELITNPSSKYDAEGTAGIININLKRQTEYSFSGIINMNGGSKDKYNSDVNLNYNLNGLNLTGGFDYRNNSNFVDQNVSRTTYTNSGDITNSTLIKLRAKQEQYTGRLGLDYTFDPSNSLSFTLSGGKYNINTSINSLVKNYTPSSSAYADNIGQVEIPVEFYSSSLNYNLKFVPGVNEVSLEAYYSTVNLPSNQLTNEYTTLSDFTNRNATPLRTNLLNTASRKEGRGKLDYKHVINPQSTFEMGVQSNFSYRKFDLVNKIFNYTNNNFSIDPLLTNKYDFRNNVYSGYLSYSNSFEGFDFQVGIRGEYMDRLLSQNTLAGDYKFTKMDYFPSLNISRKIDDHQLQLSYSRRIQRPNENLLNPFPFYSDSYLTSTGNPYLLPAYTNAFELNYQKVFGTVFMSVQTYYRKVDDQFQQIFSADNNGKMYSSFGNFAKSDYYGTEISSSFSLFDILRLDPAAELSGNKLKGLFSGVNVDKNFFNWNARLNATLTLSQDTRFMVSGNYYAKFIDAQANIKPFFFLTASIKQDFLDKRLSLTLQARNLLNTSNMDIGLSGTNYNGRVKLTNEIPVVSLMLSYNFNNFKRTTRPTDNIDIQTGL